MLHFTGQAVDLLDGLLHHAIALLRLQVRVTRGQRSLLGVLRHFLHGGGHLVHGRGGLLGFQLLRLHTGAGLRSDRRQLIGRRRDLPDATADAPHQVAQAQGHVLHRREQLPDLVAAVLRDVLTEITGGDTLGEAHALTQRADDQAGDQQSGTDTQHDGRSAHDAEHQQGALTITEHALLSADLGRLGQVDHRARTLDHGLLGRMVLFAQLLVVEEGALVQGQCLQGGIDGRLLIVVEPDGEAAGDGLQVFADVLPLLQRLG